MSMELRIFGMRRIRDAELAGLAGKTREEIEESEVFRRWHDIGRLCYYETFAPGEIEGQPKNRDILPMLRPLRDAEGQTLYVCWMEELVYWWRGDPEDLARIEGFWEKMREIVDWDQAYMRVRYEDVEEFLSDDPAEKDEDREILVVSYG